MPLPDADKKSPRVYTNLQNIDLDSVTFANVQSTGNPIAVEEMNEDEMRRLVLVNLARLVCAGEWNGLLTAGGGAETLGELTDVLLDATDFVDGLLIQTNSDGSAPTTGTLNNSEECLGIGKDCLKALTSADYCTFVGSRAGEAITTGNYNSGFGRMALYQVSTQSGNTGCGYFAGGGIQNGANNTAVGYATLGTNNDGARNTAVGGNALGAVTTGNDNIALGYNAGDSVSSGDNNVVIGGVAVASATADDQLVISSGDGGMFWIKGDSAGSCYQGDNASSWSTTSDRRIKREITDATQGLDAINGIRLRNFRYRQDNRYGLDPEVPRVGVIAQELEEVLPEAVKENLEGHKTVNVDSINWALLKAVQELSAKVDALEAAA